jgi:AmmeMemoRadiSam system protein B
MWGSEQMELVRKPTVAGMFYPGKKEALIEEIEHCFLDPPGPGKSSEPDDTGGRLFGVIVPHAGYSCSGAIAAHSYKAIMDAGFADVFIIIGPNHHGIGSDVALSPHDSWQTPLGKMSVDVILKKTLVGGRITLNETAYRYQENSVEVQLPFLQYCGRDHIFSISPIVMAMQDYETSVEVGKHLAKVIRNEKRKICIIASTDFSHEGFAYGHMPPKGFSVDEFVRKQDAFVIDHIVNMDSKRMIKTINENHISMCGYGPVIVLLTAAEIIQGKSVELLKYGTSYDMYPDSNACVGYGAFAIYEA